jgi:uncharacterized protein YgbK (DUF1537 family)
MSVRTPDPNPGWLSDDELEQIRQRLPLVYVEAIPVRVDGMGAVTEWANDALGVRALAIGREIAPGVPATVALGPVPFALTLKSGNFGGDDFFADALEAMP